MSQLEPQSWLGDLEVSDRAKRCTAGLTLPVGTSPGAGPMSPLNCIGLLLHLNGFPQSLWHSKNPSPHGAFAACPHPSVQTYPVSSVCCKAEPALLTRPVDIGGEHFVFSYILSDFFEVADSVSSSFWTTQLPNPES